MQLNTSPNDSSVGLTSTADVNSKIYPEIEIP